MWLPAFQPGQSHSRWTAVPGAKAREEEKEGDFDRGMCVMNLVC